MPTTKFGFACLGICASALFAPLSQAQAHPVLITVQEAQLPPQKSIVPSRGITRAPRIELAEANKGPLRSPVHLQFKFKPYGGTSIDLNTLQVTYLRTPNVDLTSRIKPFSQASGIDMPEAELPPGEHTLRVDIKDSDGREASTNVVLVVAP